jgi:O-antigen biosynthesis protein
LQLSVIIVSYNVKHFLEQCLHSVFTALDGLDAEVFVVDNNSVDGSVALVKQKFPAVRLIDNRTNAGFAVANNQAIKASTGKYVLLLNPDTVVQEDTFRKTLEFMEAHPDAGALGIRMLDGKGNFLPESKRGLPTPAVAFYKIFGLAKLFPRSKRFGQYHLTYLDKNETHKVDVLSGAFMLVRREALEKAGLLDETFFMYGEDIDLSYRITKAGYFNYYFAGSSIIHYKGESTKKSSVNYVLVFYKAMMIFARKHFSGSNAGLFVFMIYVAIYLRAFIAIVVRMFRALTVPAVDFALILGGLYLCKDIYEMRFKLYPNFYSREMLNFFFPLYTLLWMLFVYLFGGYDKPVRLRKIVRGMATGSAFILIVYSLLPEYYRFSRALILIGSIYTMTVYLVTRVLYHFSGIRSMQLGGKTALRIAIAGSADEFDRVSRLMRQAPVGIDFIGYISMGQNGEAHPSHIGNFSQIHEAIRVHGISEVIFCAKDIPSGDIIKTMLALVTTGVEFKIAPPESLSVIGSSSIDTAGDLYVIDVNNIGKPENRRVKRMADILISLILLAFCWLLVWFQGNKTRFLANCFKVLAGAKTWVGYGLRPGADLPALKPSVLTPVVSKAVVTDPAKLNLALLNYAKDYRVENDISIVMRSLDRLGE